MHLLEFLKSLFLERKLSIVDVGATGGPEVRWKKWSDLCFFHTFDPDPRAQPWSSCSKNYPIGLWSRQCTKMLNLTAYPPATSLFKHNHEALQVFQNHAQLEVVGKKRIKLDTLDQCLEGHSVDFIKIDAEGAELEILKGSEKILRTQCLGLQLETCFFPLHKKAPTFSELDLFVRAFDFQLFQLEREHWVRKNRILTFDSAPQLIWGNALFLLSKTTFLKRLETSPDPETLFLKYIVILLAYHLYDYAYELCEELSLEIAKELKKELRSLSPSKGRYLTQLILSLVVGGGKYALCFSNKRKQHRLCYLKRKVRELGHACLYLGKNDYALYD